MKDYEKIGDLMKPVENKTPMIMRLPPSAIIWALNQQLEREQLPDIPLNATISVRVPGGGDWSSTDLELDERDVMLDIRWEA